MKKLLLISALLVSFVFAATLVAILSVDKVNAQDGGEVPGEPVFDRRMGGFMNQFGENPPVAPDTETDPLGVLERIIDWLFYILLVVAALAIVIAGYLFVTAAGDADKVSKARNFIIYAIIGIIIAFLARGLIYFVGRVVG